MKILFVCTGNSCRSPMAEHLAFNIFKERKIDWQISSGGISVLLAMPPSQNAIDAMAGYGLDISANRTRQITREDILSADVVLTMTGRHKTYLEIQAPDFADKIFTICEYAGVGEKDIVDPFGGDLETYQGCAKELYEVIIALADKIGGKVSI